MENTNDIISNFKQPLDDRILKILSYVVNSLDVKQNDDYSKIIMIMLVPQLILYFRALDETQINTKLSTSDAYNRTAKAPEIQILQKCNDQIVNLLDKLCCSPMQKAKMNRLNRDDDTTAEDLLDSLTR
jgi:hypothetical protein